MDPEMEPKLFFKSGVATNPGNSCMKLTVGCCVARNRKARDVLDAGYMVLSEMEKLLTKSKVSSSIGPSLPPARVLPTRESLAASNNGKLL
jgi:hypothetical protein